MSAAISAGHWRSRAITATPRSSRVGAPARTRRGSRGPWRRGGRSTRSRSSRAPRSAPRAARATSGSSPAATPKPALAHRLLQQRHALDVRGLGEHVDRLHAAQPIAGLLELGGVGGQRGRVAGDVDDPRRLALDHAADDLLREPGAGRVDDDDVGLAGLLDQRPDAGAGVAGDGSGRSRSRCARRCARRRRSPRARSRAPRPRRRSRGHASRPSVPIPQ